ncbi:ABC transporter permease [Algicella marina]|uniref:FtsX-like permease family protein n=1 Tax=Algicella marina TaxID=2683284 RepID=A0A6P1SY35_9RHOB|nr:FtsX-like permease family protein [Algicella marina]QHQ35594.1 FtsX-like permease family protein [Algicella marina]
MSIRTVLRIAFRELRGGVTGFRILLICLALGVAAIAAVGTIRTSIQQGLEREGAALLGGDAEARFTYRFAEPAERDWLEDNAIAVSEVVDFRSMATTQVDGERKRALAQVKGVDDAYPLYGQVQLDPAMPIGQALEGAGGLPGMVAEKVLTDRLGLQAGDVVTLGETDFRLMAAIIREPDGVTAGFSLGPRIIVSTEALDGSGLLSTGTLYNTSYRLKLSPEISVAALRRQTLNQFRESGLRWRDNRNGTPGVSRFVDRLSSFLVLVGLAGLAVGGVGVSAAVRTYLGGKTETIATLKTLGATGATIFAIYMLQVGVLAAVGVTLGLLIGAGIPVLLAPVLSGMLPIPAVFSFYWQPLVEAGFYGLLTAMIFTIWPLARARDIRAAGLFRDVTATQNALPRPVYLIVTAVLAVLLAGVAIWASGIAFLATWSIVGIVASLAVLALAARLIQSIARKLARSRLSRGNPALRLAFGSVGGPGGETTSVVLSIGLGLTVLAAIGQIDSNLRNVMNQELPGVAPAFFFLDIQTEQLPGFEEIATGTGRADRIETAPMLRGIITRINDEPARDYVMRETGERHWALSGDRGVTYAATPPDGAEITSGSWWEEGYDGPPVMSFAEEEAEEMGLKLGDRVTINVLGRDLTAEITSFRVVEFQNMGINFLMILNPGALQGAPHSHIATVYSEPETEAALLGDLADAYPNITAIRVRDAINRVSEALNGIAAATRYGALATLLTGFVVLIGAAAAGERRRVFEAAVLKTVGATRARILTSFALRSLMLGGAAGLVAIFAGMAASWGVMRFVMEESYRFEPVSAVAIVVGGALASLLAGLAFAWRPLSLRPASVLRAKD